MEIKTHNKKSRIWDSIRSEFFSASSFMEVTAVLLIFVLKGNWGASWVSRWSSVLIITDRYSCTAQLKTKSVVMLAEADCSVPHGFPSLGVCL